MPGPCPSTESGRGSRMPPTMHRRRAPRALCSALALLVVLSGCGFGGTGRSHPEWEHDADSGRYYRPGHVLQGPELLEEHYPALAEASPRALTEGRYTDPGERVPIPAPDDHWWQAVVQLSPEEAEALRSEAASEEGGDALEAVPESELLALLVPPLEGELEPCGSGWLSVGPALARHGSTDLSEAGDLIELAALCPSSDQVVTSSTDM